MIFASDTRTNAGVDQVGRFGKMHLFRRDGDRLICVLTAGNLSITQNVVNLVQLRAGSDRSGGIWTAASMFDVASIFGETLREIDKRDGPALREHNIDASASFLIGGQINGERTRLFLLYPEGNFIEATPETPYFQIGETKYGKPIIDRVITPHSNLLDATKCVLVSFDSTMRSNLSVGLPIDLLVYATGSFHARLHMRIEETDEYFLMIHSRWAAGLKRVFGDLPPPTWFDDRLGEVGA